MFFIQIAYFSCRGNNIIFIVGIGVNRILAFERHGQGSKSRREPDTRSARRKTGQHVARIDRQSHTFEWGDGPMKYIVREG